MSDLAGKGYHIFTTISEHLPVDLIAYKNNKTYRIQVKSSKSGFIPTKTSWSDKNGNHCQFYSELDFDYFGIYNPETDKVCYPSIKFKGKRIRFQPAINNTAGYWYEDFLDFTDEATKKTMSNRNKN